MKTKTHRNAKGNPEKLRKAALAEIGQRLAGKAQGDAKADRAPTRTTRTLKAKGKAQPRRATGPRSGRMSALDAAAKVLADSDKPMRVKQVVQAMEAKGLWKSKAGKTPAATVAAAIIREIADKGKDSRFKKVDRGLFTAVSGKAA